MKEFLFYYYMWKLEKKWWDKFAAKYPSSMFRDMATLAITHDMCRRTFIRLGAIDRLKKRLEKKYLKNQ